MNWFSKRFTLMSAPAVKPQWQIKCCPRPSSKYSQTQNHETGRIRFQLLPAKPSQPSLFNPLSTAVAQNPGNLSPATQSLMISMSARKRTDSACRTAGAIYPPQYSTWSWTLTRRSHSWPGASLRPLLLLTTTLLSSSPHHPTLLTIMTHTNINWKFLSILPL